MRKLVFLAPIAAAAMALAGCGQKGDLMPAEGAKLPPAGFGEAERADSKELLELDTLAAPERSVELRKRSEEREDDPFDLPPE